MKILGILFIVSGLLLTYAVAFTTATGEETPSPAGSAVATAGQADDAWHGYFGIGMLLVGFIVLERPREPA